MAGKTILHYIILEQIGQARLHFSFVGQSRPNDAKALLDKLALRSSLIITEVHNDW